MSGILPTWYKHVHTCLNNVRTLFRQCYSTYHAETCMYISWNVYTCMYMVRTMMQNHRHVCTWYVHGMYILGYKHVRTSFRRVCTCLCMYIHVLNHINMYIQCTNLYIECCVAHVQCTEGYIHFMKCTDIAEPGTYMDISFWMQLFWFARLAGL